MMWLLLQQLRRLSEGEQRTVASGLPPTTQVRLMINVHGQVCEISLYNRCGGIN